MREIIDIGLPELEQPFSWAVKTGKFLFTSQGPVTEEGKILKGTIEEQARLTFRNLQKTLHAAGGDLKHVVQVQIFLLNMADMRTVDDVYREFFTRPYPSRSSLGISAFAAPTMQIEIVVQAVLD